MLLQVEPHGTRASELSLHLAETNTCFKIWIKLRWEAQEKFRRNCKTKLWGSVSAPKRGEENSTSGPGSSEGRSPVVPWFSRLLLLDVPGATTEQVRTCGFKRNSSSFDKAPKMRDYVLLNSFESFLVTLPSISSETWEIYSWVSSGSRTFGALPLLVLSGVSLETAANFLLFLNVAIKLGEKVFSVVKTEFSTLVFLLQLSFLF